MSKNFFDKDALFEEYIKMRDGMKSFTDLCERPAIENIIPKNLYDMVIMDLGCGYGEMTEKIAQRGAKIVYGIDISEKMIRKAKVEHQQPNIRYMVADINKLNDTQEKSLDMVCSFLALHFVKDINVLFKKVFKLLKDDGYFIFSMEHPIMTSNDNPISWEIDGGGSVEYYKLNGYFDEKYKEFPWFKKDIIVGCYHRKISTIINALINAGLTIEAVEEPEPKKEDYSEKIYNMLCSRPSVIIFKCRKK